MMSSYKYLEGGIYDNLEGKGKVSITEDERIQGHDGEVLVNTNRSGDRSKIGGSALGMAMRATLEQR